MTGLRTFHFLANPTRCWYKRLVKVHRFFSHSGLLPPFVVYHRFVATTARNGATSTTHYSREWNAGKRERETSVLYGTIPDCRYCTLTLTY